MTRPATTTVRLYPEHQSCLERIREHDGRRLGLAGPAPQSAVFRRLLLEEAGRLQKADLERAVGKPRGR